MTDNVIILGAGASVDAGIPLLANFVEKMWEFAITGKHDGKRLTDSDKKIFAEAVKVRNELDGYHGRAAFDDRNIEDILSILSFNLIGGKKSDREKLEWFIKAITRTIELTCKVTHDERLDEIQDANGCYVYQSFWRNLFSRFKDSVLSFPTIISFNYDLVLERSLLQSLIGTEYNLQRNSFPFNGIKLKYHYGLMSEFVYTAKYIVFQKMTHFGLTREEGMVLQKSNPGNHEGLLDIEILKLHGSLNFPQNKNLEFDPIKVSEKPYIMPPIINKWVGKNEETMWSIGLKRLREAKNIIIVGYSLPQTDIYLQYFLRAGVGPNVNLNKIIVYNPTLFTDGRDNELMRERFGNCFSPQLRKQMVFEPQGENSGKKGTFEVFASAIDWDKDLFFG